MKHLKLMLCSLVIAIVSLKGVDLYYQSDFHLNNELKKKITFESESEVLQNSSLNENEEDYEYEVTGSNIMIQLLSDFDSYSLRDMYINSGETDYDFILSEIRSEAKSYYTKLRSEFADKYQLDIYKEFSSPFANIHSDKVLEDVNDLDNNLKKAILDDLSIDVRISKDISYKCIDGEGGGGGDPYPDQETPSGLLGKKEVLEKINANNTGYNGSGIKIGMIESGHPDKSYLTQLNSINIYENGSNMTEHSTAVTKCISWLAPSATFYSGGTKGEFQKEILTWMNDNDVNIINISWGGPGYYSFAGEIDYFVKDNFITIVASAGNKGMNNIFGTCNTPGICNNVIAVGATNVECTDTADFSCYKVPYNIAKPNIMAPGSDIFFGGHIKLEGQTYTDGTSFSAPIVTGAVAQLMQKRPILKLYPEAVQAVLYNTANQGMLDSHDKYAGFDSRNGAGMLDVKKALDNIFNYNVRTLTSDDNYKNTITMANVYVEAGRTLNVNLNWLIGYKFELDKKYQNSDRLKTDFDLYVYNSDGETISITNSSENNSELARIPITESGNYQICLYQYNYIANPIEHIALAWSIT